MALSLVCSLSVSLCFSCLRFQKSMIIEYLDVCRYGNTDQGNPSLWNTRSDWMQNSWTLLNSPPLKDSQIWGVTWFRSFDDANSTDASEQGYGVFHFAAASQQFQWKPSALTFWGAASNWPPPATTVMSTCLHFCF